MRSSDIDADRIFKSVRGTLHDFASGRQYAKVDPNADVERLAAFAAKHGHYIRIGKGVWLAALQGDDQTDELKVILLVRQLRGPSKQLTTIYKKLVLERNLEGIWKASFEGWGPRKPQQASTLWKALPPNTRRCFAKRAGSKQAYDLGIIVLSVQKPCDEADESEPDNDF